MKLLLDEMLAAVLAEQLRSRGQDVAAVIELAELRGLGDLKLFDYAQTGERAIVTYNRDDFLSLDRGYRNRGLDHHGIVIIGPRRFPQGSGVTGQLVAALAALVASGPPYPGFVHRLQPGP